MRCIIITSQQIKRNALPFSLGALDISQRSGRPSTTCHPGAIFLARKDSRDKDVRSLLDYPHSTYVLLSFALVLPGFPSKRGDALHNGWHVERMNSRPSCTACPLKERGSRISPRGRPRSPRVTPSFLFKRIGKAPESSFAASSLHTFLASSRKVGSVCFQ